MEEVAAGDGRQGGDVRGRRPQQGTADGERRGSSAAIVSRLLDGRRKVYVRVVMTCERI